MTGAGVGTVTAPVGVCTVTLPTGPPVPVAADAAAPPSLPEVAAPVEAAPELEEPLAVAPLLPLEVVVVVVPAGVVTAALSMHRGQACPIIGHS